MPPLPARRSWSPDTRFVVRAFVCSRLFFFSLAWIALRMRGLDAPLDEALCQWDCAWYRTLFEKGYDPSPHHGPGGADSPVRHDRQDAANWAFFPLYPLTVRAVAGLLPLAPLQAAYLVSNLCFLGGVLLLHRHARTLADERTARFVTLAAVFSPLALYLSVPYTEALYLLLMTATIHLASTRRWLLAGCCAAALSATRNLGVMIVFPMLAIAIGQFGWRTMLRPGAARGPWIAMALAPLGLALYMLFLHAHVGDALAFKNVQLAWDREVGNPARRLWWALHSANWTTRYFAVTALVAGLLAACLAWRRRIPEALIVLIGLLIPLSTAVDSLPRYVLTLFPVPLALGLLTERRARLRLPLVLILLALNALYVDGWITGRRFLI